MLSQPCVRNKHELCVCVYRTCCACVRSAPLPRAQRELDAAGHAARTRHTAGQSRAGTEAGHAPARRADQ